MPAEPALLSLPFDDWSTRLEPLGARAFHASSLRRWLFERGVIDPLAMTDLPTLLRESLAAGAPRLFATREVERHGAPDGTTKLLLELDDGKRVETVHIPGRDGPTLCVSTQVGCAVGCPFCASGMLGLERNLATHEIVEQFLRGQALGRLSRAVVMGIGEPSMNLENTLAALDTIHAPTGLNLGARRITISTVGFPRKIRRLARHPVPYQVAISIHAVDQALRDRLVPIMHGTSLETIHAACRDYFDTTGRELTIEYVLLRDVNDSATHAQALARWMQGLRATANLIPYNPVSDLSFQRPEAGTPEAFAAELARRGIKATIRWSKGLDEAAACGQLRIRSRAGGTSIHTSHVDSMSRGSLNPAERN